MTQPSIRSLSTVVLITTAMAWGVAAQAADVKAKAKTSSSAKADASGKSPTGADVSEGTNSRIDADTRARALSRTGGQGGSSAAPGATPVGAAGSSGTSPSGAGTASGGSSVMEGVKNTARKVGDATGRAWDRAKTAVKTNNANASASAGARVPAEASVTTVK